MGGKSVVTQPPYDGNRLNIAEEIIMGNPKSIFVFSIPAAKVSDFLPSLVLLFSIDTQAKRDLHILLSDSW
jgi:hypothetical protein